MQARGGSGLKAAKIDKARGNLVAVCATADTLAFLAADACLVVPGQGVRAASRDGGGSKVCPAGLQRVGRGRAGEGGELGRGVFDRVPVARREIRAEVFGDARDVGARLGVAELVELETRHRAHELP